MKYCNNKQKSVIRKSKENIRNKKTENDPSTQKLEEQKFTQFFLLFFFQQLLHFHKQCGTFLCVRNVVRTIHTSVRSFEMSVLLSVC